jgi:hypothetical protein
MTLESVETFYTVAFNVLAEIMEQEPQHALKSLFSIYILYATQLPERPKVQILLKAETIE